MKPDKELQIAYRLAGVCLVIGIIAYVAFPAPAPHPPLRLAYPTMAGKVLFDHEAHSSATGYALSCIDCHHTMEEGDTEPDSCGACHTPESEDIPKRTEAFHEQCGGCHADFGSGPAKEQCAACHAM